MKTLMKPISFFVPITRIDSEKRIVEGIAFANEVVEGEGGLRLLSSAMEDCTPDYMKWGTIRAMHQPSAAGTAVPNDAELAKECGVVWEDGPNGTRVARLASYISDDADWKKCLDGTYKGYSVGVQARVMRGKNVEKCTWIETSLVDRPKDPDALITACRVDGFPDESEVEVLDVEDRSAVIEGLEAISRGMFADAVSAYLPSRLRYIALDMLGDVLYSIQSYDNGTPQEKSEAALKAIAEFGSFIAPIIASGAWPDSTIFDDPSEAERAASPTLTRFAAASVDAGRVAELTETISTLTLGRDESSAELTRVQGLLGAAEERVRQMENEPVRKPPVRFPEAAERTFGSQAEKPDAVRIKALRDELEGISQLKPTSDGAEGDQRVVRISQIKRELRSIGESV